MQFLPRQIRPSILHLIVFAFFAILIAIYVITSGDVRMLIWGIPTLLCLLAFPMALTYLSQNQYADLIPVYEVEAKNVKIREINQSMISKPIRIEGLVEEVRFRSLNRPHFIIGDRTGVTTVKMFTSPKNDISKGDVVEVYGQVIRRYFFAGDPIINGVHIQLLDSDKAEKASLKKKAKN
ncbi:MAG: nucleotide-binding protein [Methanomicrobiales archaeon]|nr:nucleotide-binding protein [Methanomicrobiales archaeon]